MKINVTPLRALSTYGKVSKPSEPKKAMAPGKADTVEVSEDARLFFDVLKDAKKLMGANEVQTERIAALKERVLSGEYSVDTSELSGKILL